MASSIEEVESSQENERYLIRLPETIALLDDLVRLSPLDIMCRGRAIPMVWFYKDSLPTDALLAALNTTLASHQVLCGRYTSSPPYSIDPTNNGVMVTVSKSNMLLKEAIVRIPSSEADTIPHYFSLLEHEKFVPFKGEMDPDSATSEVPLLAIKITHFSEGGTAIGILVQHGVYDGEAQTLLMKHWSQVFRGMPLDPTPDHNRCNEVAFQLTMPPSKVFPTGCEFNSFPIGEQRHPEFASIMPRIAGKQVCVIPFPKAALMAIKAESMDTPLPEGQFVSTDDLLVARVWKGLCEMRCRQLSLSTDCEEITVLSRACNIRQRTEPKLGVGYCANGAINVRTALSVREILSMSTRDVALKLRVSLIAQTPSTIAAVMQLYRREHDAGNRTRLRFDRNALTFIISSWMFDWEEADFRAKPICFEHGALVPVVSVFTPRPNGDGINVWLSGPQEALEYFVRAVRMQQ